LLSEIENIYRITFSQVLEDKKMIVTCVHVTVKEEHINDFIEASKANYDETIKEPGNLRFDVLQNTENRAKFMIYEVFKSEADVAYHKTTSHYLKWRDAVADWMAEPRKGIRYDVITPKDETKW